MRLTEHAIQQYIIRTGRRELSYVEIAKLKSLIETAKELKYVEAVYKGFSIIKRIVGDKYYTWHDDNINEDLLAIVAKDGGVKTIMTKGLYSWCNKPMKMRSDRLCQEMET